MSSLNNAISLQLLFDARLTADIAEFEKLESTTNKEEISEVILKDLEEEFLAAKERHDKIVVAKTNEAKKYIDDDIFTKIRLNYYKFWGAIKKNLPKHIKAEESNLNSTFGPMHKASQVRLPKLDLPSFNGNYENWLAFHNIFTSSVHNNFSIEPVDKLRYLLSALSGEALNLVKLLEITDENYLVARNLLIQRYQHNRSLINSFLDTLYDFEIKGDNACSLRDLVNTINECSYSLKQLKIEVQNYQLLRHISRKLPNRTRIDWEDSIKSSTDVPEFSTFMTFLSERFRSKEQTEVKTKLSKESSSVQKTFHIKSQPQRSKKSSRPNSNHKLSCITCNGKHSSHKCEQFRQLTQQQRFDLIKNNKGCINCLNKSHTVSDCKSNQTCRVCQGKHHSLLHRYNSSEPNYVQRSHSVEEQQPSVSYLANNHEDRELNHNFHIKASKGTLLGTAQISAVNEAGFSIAIRALIDPCSDDNYILSSTVQSLRLKKYYDPSVIGVLGNDESKHCTHKVNITIHSMDNRFQMRITANVVDSITSDLPQLPLANDSFSSLSNLQLADPNFNVPSSIHVLLGVGVHTRIMLNEFRRCGDDLVAENTLFGYLIRGSAPINKRHVLLTQSTAVALQTQIKKFWETEELISEPVLKPEDQLCEQIFTSTVKIDSTGHISVDLPFKDNIDPIIGPSRYMAEKRFLSLENKLEKNKTLKTEYHKTIQNYLDSNHLIKITKSSVPTKEYFLPHHAVIKESSSTTKVRVVFDASCKSLDGTSLNDHLLTGPKLQKDIRDIVFNWRQYPISLTADIEKMYRMFNISPKHHAYQKIVWRFNKTDPIEDYALTTATFGTSSAPFIAIRSLHFIADENKSSHPSVSHSLINEFYVDDYISGAFTENDAIQKQVQIRAVLNQYNLSIRKWSSNSTRVNNSIPKDLLDESTEISFDDTDYRKTLGIYWSREKDSFFFSIHDSQFELKFTKRKILSLIARLYDPLGWVSPCTMYAKQMMQQIWQTKVEWDDPVDETINAQFKIFLEELQLLKQFSIPRWTNISDNKSPLTIVGFCDASDKGYGAVVYLVNPKPKSEKDRLILLTSKTRVADLKYESTARLELNGAVLLSKLLKWIVNLYKPRKTQVIAFCDSKIVLAWLQCHPAKWKTYIANRTTQILEWMSANQWNYINTKENPADVCSRGLMPSELINCNLWTDGPNIDNLTINAAYNLSDDQSQLFSDSIKKSSHVLHTKSMFRSSLLTKYSNHFRTKRHISFVTKFFNNICTKLAEKLNMKLESYTNRLIKLSSQHRGTETFHIQFLIKTTKILLKKCQFRKIKYMQIMDRFVDPEHIIFRLVQQECYAEDINSLQSNKHLSNKSALKEYYPFIDRNGILRVGGRLENSELDEYQKHPIILPSKHQVTTNLIDEAHMKTEHGNELETIAYLRNKFQIPRMTDKVKRHIHRCMRCSRFARKNQEVLMGSLPKDRVRFSSAFQHTGVDYAGPITIKAYPGRCKKFLKSYIALFICLCTKAIHLEVVSSLSSQSFIDAFHRFVGRRGRCHKLYSDNGTNFIGANKILNNELLQAEKTWKNELQINFQKLGTEWNFIPPSSPHFGGLWEAGVKSVKTHLRKTVGQSILTYEELNTILIKIEAVLNSRPLCRMSNDPNQYNYLTPAHFLIGRPLVAPLGPSYDLDKKCHLQRWNHAQLTFHRFVKLWQRDYLQNLQSRPKGQKSNVKFEKGNLVLLAEDDMPPTLWPVVIIDDVFPGNDGIVRVVNVKSPNGKILKRPVVKLRLLPCNEPNQS